jgi:nucleoside-diphosphate-sugar epimerase
VNSNTTALYKDVRVLVLGASGFIGRQVASRLGQSGADLALAVRNTNSLSTKQFSGEILEIDLLDFEAVSGLITQTSPTVVFNLAGYGIDPGERDETKARRINADLLPVVTKAISRVPASRWRGQRIVHTGSALEYGISSGDLSEASTPTPTTLYGQTKLAGTQALQRDSRSMGLASVTARLFTVYGPGEHAGRLLPSLLEAARSGSPVDLTEGKQQRDFTYVEDVVEGLLRLGITHTLPGDIVNVATGQLTSVRQFIETAARIMGIPHDHLHFGALPTRVEEMQHKPVAVRKLKELTSWIPAISVAQGIRLTCQRISESNNGIVYG